MIYKVFLRCKSLSSTGIFYKNNILLSTIRIDYFFFLNLVVTPDCGFCQSKGLRRYMGHGGTVIRAAITNPAPRI